MAKLTKGMVDLQAERTEKTVQALKKKAEINRKKELYGENWRKVEEKKLTQEIEFEVGSDKAPKLYDFKDLYDFFDPISFYRDEENKVLKMDYDKFIESQEKYKKAIDEVDKFLQEQKNNSDKKELLSDKKITTLSEDLIGDGEDPGNNDTPIPPNVKDGDIKTPVTNRGRAKGNLHKILSTYFNRFVPLYNKYVCSCCGSAKGIENYYVTYDISCGSIIDKHGSLHMPICKECCQRLFAYIYSHVAGKNAELAMQNMCSYINLYWDVDMYQIARKSFESSDRKGTLIGEYIKLVNSEVPGTTFMDSPFLKEEHYSAIMRVTDKEEEIPLDWTKEEVQCKKDTIRIVGWDPFADIKDESSRKTLYQDFCSLIDEDLAQDWIKCQSAITIVKSFLKVRQLDAKLADLEENDSALAEQKAVADLKKKELDAITTFCQNNGWSERYKSRVSKGETSFSGIMKTMNEKKYENAMVNKYDIATGATMQQAADISMNAIMKQLSFSDAEVWKITQEQYSELVKIRRENMRLEEELRKAKYDLAAEKLKAKAEKEDRGEL